MSLTGCSENDKDQFRMDLGDYICTIPKDERLLIGADLNGRGGIHQEKGKRLLDLTDAHDLVMANK